MKKMNQNLFDWSNFKIGEKVIVGISIVVLAITFIGTVYGWSNGLENVLRWDIISELNQVPVLSDAYSDGNLKFGINGLAYFVNERYSASPMEVSRWSSYAFLIAYLSGVVLILSSLVRKKGFWFLLLMLLIAVISISFHFENIFKSTNQYYFLGIFLIVAGISYYFNAWDKKGNIIKHYLGYLVIIALLAVFVISQSQIKVVSVALANYGIIGAIVISAIFIYFIAHEIIAALVNIVISTGVKKSDTLKPFMVLSGIYLLNTLLIYLENARVIDWNIMIISPLLLYTISLILGFWGFKRFCEQTNILDYKSEGLWLYLGMAIITTATIGYSIFTGNDPLKEAFEDYLAICHLVLGLSFFVYVLINFNQALKQGLEVNKVLYKPIITRLTLPRIAAVFGIVVLLAFKNFFSYFQVMAGYNNAIADYYVAEGDWITAEAYYKEATHYDLYNHKSNYALASMAMKMGDKINAGFFFKQAVFKNPTTYAYIGLSQNLQAEDLFFEALFVVRDGLKKFPHDKHLLTNMAYLQNKAKLTDSTLHYLKLATENCSDCGVEEANLLGFWVKNAEQDKLENIIKESPDKNYTSYQANRAALIKRWGSKDADSKIEIPKDSVLSTSAFANLYNQITTKNNEAKISDEDLKHIQNKTENDALYEDMVYMRAFNAYYRGHKIDGLKQLMVLANDSTDNQAINRQTLGMWFLQEGVYNKAIGYLNKAGDKASVDLLEQKDYQSKMSELQQNQANSLMKNNSKQEAITKAPLNPYLVEAIVKQLNSQKGQEQKAYQIVFDAIDLNEDSAVLWKLYILQSLKIGLSDYANNGLEKLQKLLPSTDYQAFLSSYQAQKALIEKSRESF